MLTSHQLSDIFPGKMVRVLVTNHKEENHEQSRH
jgi:hypothetical protein